MIPKVAPWKKDTVSSLVDKVNAGSTLAIIDIHGVPADTMINMRADLRDKMAIQVAKKRLMKLAWENAGRELSELDSLFEGAVQPALVSTQSLNSFELFTELKRQKQVEQPNLVMLHHMILWLKKWTLVCPLDL